MEKTILGVFTKHPALLGSGFLLIFFSVFGQSVFLGAYMDYIRDDYGLTHTKVGSLYAAATIISSIVITFTGRGLDKFPLRDFLSVALIGVAVGCFLLATGHSALWLFVTFFVLRQFGQGLLPLTAQTAINRYLTGDRGKGMALINFGGPAHIMLFPLLAIAINQIIPWRTAWLIYGTFVLLILLPLFRFLLRNHESTTHAAWKKSMDETAANIETSLAKQWTRRNVLSDWRFYALVSILVLAPFAGTAVFFFQSDLAASLGMTKLAFAGSFPVFTGFSIVCAMIAGVTIDKIGEKPVLIGYPPLYALAILIITHTTSLPLLYLGMGILGGATGMMSTAGGPLLAHLYGTKHLGSIKALTMSASILSSALAPFLFGVFIDLGYDIAHSLSWVAWYAGAIWLVALPLFRSIDGKK